MYLHWIPILCLRVGRIRLGSRLTFDLKIIWSIYYSFFYSLKTSEGISSNRFISSASSPIVVPIFEDGKSINSILLPYLPWFCDSIALVFGDKLFKTIEAHSPLKDCDLPKATKHGKRSAQETRG